MVVMLVSSVANIIVSRMLFKVGKETESIALQADAWHLRTDVYTSAGVMIGLAVMTVGRFLFPDTNLQWIDPVAAMLVAVLIIKAAYDLTVASGRDLLDNSLPPEEEESIRRIISVSDERILGFHDLRTRRAGSDRFVEFHLLVSSKMTVDESHAIAHELTRIIKDRFSGCAVTAHIEPCSGKCTGKCSSGCLLSAEERKTAVAARSRKGELR